MDQRSTYIQSITAPKPVYQAGIPPEQAKSPQHPALNDEKESPMLRSLKPSTGISAQGTGRSGKNVFPACEGKMMRKQIFRAVGLAFIPLGLFYELHFRDVRLCTTNRGN
jgi:hypothetical protein